MRIAFTYNLQQTNDPSEAEFDSPETISMIEEAIRELGHEVKLIDAIADVETIIKELKKFKPDLVFNTAEGLKGKSREAFCPALFEALEIPFCASDAYTCTLTLDKNLTKLVLRQQSVLMAPWLFVDNLKQLENFQLKYPVIIKPNFEGSSKGISLKNIIENEIELKHHTPPLLQAFPEGLIIEEFIQGIDLTVPYLASVNPLTHGVLTPCRYHFRDNGNKNSKYRIYDFELKQFKYQQVLPEVASDLPNSLFQKVIKTSQTIYQVLNVKDVGRIDFRLTDDGQLYFLEINALPCLQEGASIYLSAAYHGLKIPQEVIEKIIESAIKRYQIEVK